MQLSPTDEGRSRTDNRPVRFGLDDDRQSLRDTARGILSRLCPPEAVRAAWHQPPDPRPWQALAEAGALTTLVPEADGGLGLDETYLVAVLEEAGRSALPHPLTETALVAAPLGVFSQMVATDLGTVGAAAGATSASVEQFRDRSAPSGAPASPIVPAATYADAFLLASGAGELRLFDAGEVDLEPVDTVDASRHCARVRPRTAGELVTSDAAAVAAAFDRGALGTAAQLVGLSRAMLELTVAYVAQRHQFGKPVGSFQAVKHHLADARLQIEFAAPAVLYAAYAIAHRQDDASRSVSQAKYLSGVAAASTGRAALQCHGAVGYTTEYDLHLFLKRSWALAQTWGGADFHADRVAMASGL